MHRVEFEQWVAAPLHQVFRFFGNPWNLPRLMPPWMQVQLERTQIVPVPTLTTGAESDKNLAGVGSVLIASYRALPFVPFRIESEAKITSYAFNDHFEDIQSRGPFKSWHHRHEFCMEPRGSVEGTLIRDTIEYDPGAGMLGSLASYLFIAPQLKRTFVYRQMMLAKIVRDGELS